MNSNVKPGKFIEMDTDMKKIKTIKQSFIKNQLLVKRLIKELQ